MSDRAALASAGLIIVVTFLLFWGAPEMQIQGKTFGVGNLLMCSLTGLVITAALVWITEYYTATAFRPVRSIAQGFPPRPAPTSFRASPCPWNPPLCRLS